MVLGTDAVLADPASESGAGLFASINATAATPQVLVQPRRPDFTAAAASAQPCSSCWLWESDSKSFSRRKSRDARLEAAQPLTHTCAGTRTGGRGPAQSWVELRLPSRRWKDAPGEQRRGGARGLAAGLVGVPKPLLGAYTSEDGIPKLQVVLNVRRRGGRGRYTLSAD